MPVAAGVVGDERVRAVLAARDMAAERCRAAALDADITFNWSRLTWPALARRHAGPWSRKISATSKAGRSTRAARQVGGRISLSLTAMCSSGLITALMVLVATRA